MFVDVDAIYIQPHRVGVYFFFVIAVLVLLIRFVYKQRGTHGEHIIGLVSQAELSYLSSLFLYVI